MVCLCLLVSTVHLDGVFVLKFVKVTCYVIIFTLNKNLILWPSTFLVTYAGSRSVHVVTSIATKKGPKVKGGFDNFCLPFVLSLSLFYSTYFRKNSNFKGVNG